VLDEILVGHPDAGASDRSRLGNTLDNLAQLVERTGRVDEAEAVYERAAQVRLALHEEAPQNAGFLRELVQTLNNLGILHARLGHLDEAEPILVRAIALADELAEESRGTANENVVAVTRGNLAGVRVLLGRSDDARQDYESELALRRSIALRHPAVIEYQVFLGTVLCNLGELETRVERAGEAAPWFDEAIEAFERILAIEPRHATTRHSLSYTYSWRARAMEQLGRLDRARESWEHAIEYDDRSDASLREGLERVRSRQD
jgi:tetratricopeptide (TPR) repeat protein